MTTPTKPIAIYYEHPDWFKPLFAELERRDIPYVKLPARVHFYTPASKTEANEYALVFNRMSPSAHLRGGQNAIFYTHNYLAHLERLGVRVINGTEAFRYETSKALQLEMLEALGLPYPATRVFHSSDFVLRHDPNLRFPVVLKINTGGSGAGVIRFDSLEELRKEAAHQRPRTSTENEDMGVDGTALLQEYITPRDGHITRVETLGGKYLYAINVYTTGESFNLCPADICQTAGGVELTRNACPVDAPKSGLTVEAYTPPPHVIEAVERIVQTAKIDVGGVEYMVDDRDGQILYYDINALSNFVADAKRVIGFDPHERLVDFLIQEARY